MNDESPVGPVDVAAFLADVRAGKVQARTKTVRINLKPAVADAANAIIDELEALDKTPTGQLSITEVDPRAARRGELEAEYDELAAEYEASAADFVFRGERVGDLAAVDAAIKADGRSEKDPDVLLAYRTAHFCTSPKLSGADMVDLMSVIGVPQAIKLAMGWQSLMVAPAPLSQRRSAGRVITTH